jgi:protein arginine N-methyltransferase 1
MYGLAEYALMVADRVRMTAYADALAEVVRPGCVVADIGAGTGVLAIMACKLGARRVFAIDPSAALSVADELARENGVADRLECFREDSRKITLPERADVIVSDLRGSLPLYADHLGVIADARARFLAPGGVLVPRRDVLWAALVHKPALYEAHCGLEEAAHGVKLRSAIDRLIHLRAHEREATPEDLVSRPAPWAELDYATLSDDAISGRVRWELERDGVAHGVLLWFEAQLTSRVGFSTGPGIKTVYPRTLLPFPHPLELTRSQEVELELWVGPRGEPFTWHTTVRSPAGSAVVARYRQSTFLGSAERPTPRKEASEASEASERK